MTAENHERPTMAKLQESDYGAGRQYEKGSPHLSHAHLRAQIEGDLDALVRRQVAEKGHCRAVEVGGGHGVFTQVLVDAGAEVVVTEMSAPSARHLTERFADSPAVTVVHDPNGNALTQDAARGCDLAVFVSVLHHIPDYLTTVRKVADLLAPRADLYCAQDPLWYPRRTRASLAVSNIFYLAWRLTQGDLARGVASRLRWARGRYDESNPSDMIEYHVVRRGVDEEALASLLRSRFAFVDTRTYWSTQSTLLQNWGERLGLVSSFAVTAKGTRANGAGTLA